MGRETHDASSYYAKTHVDGGSPREDEMLALLRRTLCPNMNAGTFSYSLQKLYNEKRILFEPEGKLPNDVSRDNFRVIAHASLDIQCLLGTAALCSRFGSIW